MNSFGIVDVKVPEHGVVGAIGLRMPLMASVHRGKLDGIPNEEDRKIIEDKVLNTLFGIELGRPTSNIANCVAGSLLATDS